MSDVILSGQQYAERNGVVSAARNVLKGVVSWQGNGNLFFTSSHWHWEKHSGVKVVNSTYESGFLVLSHADAVVHDLAFDLMNFDYDDDASLVAGGFDWDGGIITGNCSPQPLRQLAIF